MIRLVFVPILSTGLLVLTLPWADQGYLAWIAFIPLLYVLSSPRLTLRLRMLISGCVGWVYAFIVLLPLSTLNVWWWTGTGWWFEHRHIVLLIVLGVVAFIGGFLLWSALAWVYSWQKNAFFLGIVWSALELLRVPLVGGFTWGALGYSQHNQFYSNQIVDIIGVIGLSGVIVGVNVLLFKILMQSAHRKARLGILLCIALLLAGYSARSFHTHSDRGGDLHVRVLHSEETTVDLYTSEGRERFLNHLERALADSPDILVTPENSIPLQLFTDEMSVEKSTKQNQFEEVRTLSEAHPDTSIYLGMHRVDADSKRFNTLIHMKNGVAEPHYDKTLLIPATENALPFFFDEHVAPLTAGEDRARDTAFRMCSEIGQLRSDLRGQLAITPANDSVFDSSLAGVQHHIINTMLSIQYRRYTLHSTKQGVTGIISPTGNILDMHTDTSGYAEAMIPKEVLQ